MSRSSITRRPFNDEAPPETLIPYMPTTNLYARNSIAITRDVNGKLSVVEINDGFVKKTLTISRDGNGKISNVATTLTKVVP